MRSITAKINPSGLALMTVEIVNIQGGAFRAAGATQSRFGSPGVHRMQYVTAAVPGTSTVVFDNFSCGKA